MGIKQIEQFSDIILRILRFLAESSGVTKLELFQPKLVLPESSSVKKKSGELRLAPAVPLARSNVVVTPQEVPAEHRIQMPRAILRMRLTLVGQNHRVPTQLSEMK